MSTAPKSNRTTHTPGPWEHQTHLGNNGWHRVWPVFKRTNFTKLPACEGGWYALKNEADARLIAHAPDMLAMLKYVRANVAVNCICKFQPLVGGEVPCDVCKIEALIAKAEGR